MSMDAIFQPDHPVSGFPSLERETGNEEKPERKRMETDLSESLFSKGFEETSLETYPANNGNQGPSTVSQLI